MIRRISNDPESLHRIGLIARAENLLISSYGDIKGIIKIQKIVQRRSSFGFIFNNTYKILFHI